MIDSEDLISAGKILKPHGLKGEMNIVSDYNTEILNLGYPMVIEMDGIFVPFYVESYRPKNTFSALVKFQGFDSADDTRRFVNNNFYLLRKDVAEYLQIDEDEIEEEIELVGLTLIDNPTGFRGKIIDTFDNGVYTLMEVESEDGLRTVTLPFVDEFIESIDLESGVIKTNMPDGLIDENKAESDN